MKKTTLKDGPGAVLGARRDKLHRALDAAIDKKRDAMTRRNLDYVGDKLGKFRAKDSKTPLAEYRAQLLAAKRSGDPDKQREILRSAGKEYTNAELHSMIKGVNAAKDGAKARDANGDYEVVWTNRAYKTQRKVFKNDPQGAPGNGEKKARKFAKNLEEKDRKDPIGNIRGRVDVKAADGGKAKDLSPAALTIKDVIAAVMAKMKVCKTPEEQKALSAKVKRLQAGLARVGDVKAPSDEELDAAIAKMPPATRVLVKGALEATLERLKAKAKAKDAAAYKAGQRVVVEDMNTGKSEAGTVVGPSAANDDYVTVRTSKGVEAYDKSQVTGGSKAKDALLCEKCGVREADGTDPKSKSMLCGGCAKTQGVKLRPE